MDLFLDVPLLKRLQNLSPDSGLVSNLIKIAKNVSVDQWPDELNKIAKEETNYLQAHRIYLKTEDRHLKAYAYEIFVSFILEYSDFLTFCREKSEQRKGKLIL